MRVASLKVKLFGEFGVWRGEEPIEGEEWGGQKPRSLLKLLLTRPGHAFSKDEIVEALWPGVSLRDADRRLRITVSQLRRALEPQLGRGSDSRYVLSQRPGYSFNKQADCEVDTWKFEEHRQQAEAAQEAGELDDAIREYREASDLARGEFLAEEPYEDWAIAAREGRREGQLAVLSGLAECLALKGCYSEAIEACERALALDGYRDGLYRRLMLYHYCAGEQGLALHAYRDYARVLREELGTDPSPELARLKEQIEKSDVPGVDEMRRYPKPRRPLRFPYSLSRTRFVGRDEEYAWLAERLREVVAGTGGAVAIEGEAGVGKTRLAEEFLGYARSRGALVLNGRCFERELSAPLEPVLDALRSLPGMEGAILDTSTEPRYQQEAEPHDSARVYRTLTRELVRTSQDDGHDGLLLFVDDVQWADLATLDFLAYLARRILNERILLVFTYRREDAPGLSGWLNRLGERRVVTTLSLDRLTLEDVVEMLRRMSSRAFAELPKLADFLYRESEGNAFYAIEYLRWLIEAGIVEIDARRHISGLDTEQLREGVLPSGVRSLLKAWLDEVGEKARGLLELAAVVGRSFDLRLLCKASGRYEAETFGLMRPLMASGLVVETPELAYYFSHDKLRQTLYEGLEGLRRRELNLGVAEALEDAGEPAELAHHYLRAREWRSALENLMLAARRAEERYAWDTALMTYARALEVLEKLPEVEETRFELLGARDRLLEQMDRREERGEAVRQMLELAEWFGDRVRVAEVHVRRIGVLAAVSDLEGAEEAGRAALAIFRELADKAKEARVHRELSYVRWMHGDYAAAQEANFEVLRIHRELDDRPGEAGDAWNIAQVFRGMGDDDEALGWFEESARIYGELGDKLGKKLGENMRAEAMSTIHLERGDPKAALPFELEILRHNIQVGAKHQNVPQHIHCGTLYLRLGDPREALVHFRAAAHLSREIGHTRYEGQSLMSMGISLERLGNPAEAVETYRQAVDLLEKAHKELGIDEALRAKADALALLGRLLHNSLDRPEEALRAYDTAADVYQEVGDTSRVRELLLNLSGLRWRLGDLEGSAWGYERTLALSVEHDDDAREAAALASLSVVYHGLSRLQDSLRSGQAALRLLRDLDDLQAEAYVLTSMADSHVGLGHYPSALSCLRRSLRLRRKIGDEEGEIGALRDLAKVYEKLGDADRARVHYEEAVRKAKTSEAVSGGRNQ
jgi:DNA-binding SARP family transcriptional activator/Flp pilus assembly protein TadD